VSAPFLFHATIFIVASTVALSLGQAWAVGGPSRRARHLLVWAAGFALMVWLGMRVLGLRWSDPIMVEGPLRRSLVTVSGVLAAVSLGAASAWGRYRSVETASFSRRALTLSAAHIAAVMIGGALAYVLIAIIWISLIH
jgi:hypothetical protein